ncbi:dihydrofolate reductase [Paenibacillus montaniterrae]|uniref:Dihydrofolate reductase n=1 Tax=Paenibacillus montaniterrae TaxID=429341 RepID=A0A920CXB6_9BACL|nr:dihydrofolate reductase [Paenibacillus montaniterrae]GIP14889.1 dihydrofolate reductase [Paenibacillus montaniterrae]
MTVSLIAAMSRERAIGADNKMLWHLPKELAHFKRTTLNKTVLMGRKTYESLGKPLPNRHNVILTRQTGLQIEGCDIVHSVEEALQKYGDGELMITGGGEIYQLFMPIADRLYLTEVDVNIANADAFFPEFDENQFQLISSEKVEKDEKNKYSFTIHTYDRVK